ncbi:MAG: hypothetical protein LBV08_03435 [Clostridiales bacterium]|jgi:hypothetical protein|nr:hypothetical protein [Clostridiales bacterium]
MKNKIMPLTIIFTSALIISVAVLSVCAFGGNINLLEFETVYIEGQTPVGGIQFKLGNTIYSKYVSDEPIQDTAGTKWLKEIGFARGNNGGMYRIFEYGGYPQEKFILAEGGGLPAATLFTAGTYQQPPSPVYKFYYLENATEKEKFENLSSIILFNDGTAKLGTPYISSYSMPNCIYEITENELLIKASIDNSENAYSVKNGDILAKFIFGEDGAIVFESAIVPISADVGSRYVLQPPGALPHRIVDYYQDPQMPWGESQEFLSGEFLNVKFRWSSNAVTATGQSGEKEIIYGMPVWSVYLQDLTGDGRPEICSTVSFGSGIVDTRVVVYDYAASKQYVLEDRAVYDYVLLIMNNELRVNKYEYNGEMLGSGRLAIIDGELTIQKSNLI